LRLDVGGGVATVTLNRPRRRNAVGDGMREELADAYPWCDRADDVRVVVVTGTPPAFCAGADLGSRRADLHRTWADVLRRGHRRARMVGEQAGDRRRERPHAIGLGLTPALQCDIPVGLV
jgi:enoyl-CoA hydratase/carnithine racemase